MRYFTRQENGIVFRSNGETVVVTPWGKDSLRVRAVQMADIRDDRFALLEPDPAGQEPEITLDDERAVLKNGKITAVIEVSGWTRNARLSFYNQKGELLFRETDSGNALTLTPREYVPQTGGDFALNVTFEGNDGERLYGMGQYQEEEIDWKGCTLELKHRNSRPVCHSSSQAAATASCGTIPRSAMFLSAGTVRHGMLIPQNRWITGSRQATDRLISAVTMLTRPAMSP